MSQGGSARAKVISKAKAADPEHTNLKKLKDKVLQIVVLSKTDKSEADRLLKELTFMTTVPQQPLHDPQPTDPDLMVDITQIGSNLESMQLYLRTQVNDLQKLRTLITKLH